MRNAQNHRPMNASAPWRWKIFTSAVLVLASLAIEVSATAADNAWVKEITLHAQPHDSGPANVYLFSFRSDGSVTIARITGSPDIPHKTGKWTVAPGGSFTAVISDDGQNQNIMRVGADITTLKKEDTVMVLYHDEGETDQDATVTSTFP